MSDAYRCDRCGSFTEDRGSKIKQFGAGSVGINGIVADADMDLCQDCTKKLTDWWYDLEEDDS